MQPDAEIVVSDGEIDTALGELTDDGVVEAIIEAANRMAVAAAAEIVREQKIPPKPPKKTPAPAKRRPGRPPSKPQAPSLEKKGIVDSPNDPNNRLEVAFEEPAIFKSLFAYFKNICAHVIHVRCNASGMTFFTRDHSKKARIIAYVSGEHLNWYYCEGEDTFGINKDGVEKLFNTIDRSFSKITFVKTYDNPTWLNIIFKDMSIDKECSYDIALSQFPRDVDLFAAEDLLDPQLLMETFPLEFTLSAKQFKKTINDACNYADHATIERIGKHPLMFTYARPNLIYRETYHSDEKIHFRSSVQDGETFQCTINVVNVKSIAASMVTDDVRIMCPKSGDILFRSAIDAKALVVNTFMPLEAS